MVIPLNILLLCFHILGNLCILTTRFFSKNTPLMILTYSLKPIISHMIEHFLLVNILKHYQAHFFYDKKYQIFPDKMPSPFLAFLPKSNERSGISTLFFNSTLPLVAMKRPIPADFGANLYLLLLHQYW